MELPPPGKDGSKEDKALYFKDEEREGPALYRDVRGQNKDLADLLDLFGGLPININVDDAKEAGKWQFENAEKNPAHCKAMLDIKAEYFKFGFLNIRKLLGRGIMNVARDKKNVSEFEMEWLPNGKCKKFGKHKEIIPYATGRADRGLVENKLLKGDFVNNVIFYYGQLNEPRSGIETGGVGRFIDIEFKTNLTEQQEGRA